MGDYLRSRLQHLLPHNNLLEWCLPPHQLLLLASPRQCTLLLTLLSSDQFFVALDRWFAFLLGLHLYYLRDC